MARGDGDTDRAARGGDGASTSGSADQSYIAVLRCALAAAAITLL